MLWNRRQDVECVLARARFPYQIRRAGASTHPIPETLSLVKGWLMCFWLLQ